MPEGYNIDPEGLRALLGLLPPDESPAAELEAAVKAAIRAIEEQPCPFCETAAPLIRQYQSELSLPDDLCNDPL